MQAVVLADGETTMFKITPERRQPLCELDDIISISITPELSSLLVPYMQISAGSAAETIWTASIHEEEDQYRYPKSPVDLRAGDGWFDIVTTKTFGLALIRGWIEEELSRPMITQVPKRACA